MASNWKAEILDRIQDKFFADEEHDRTIRCLLTFHDTIDARRVVQAIEKLVEEVPILNSTFQENSGAFTWNSRGKDKSLLWAQWNSWPLFFQDYLGVSDPATSPQIKVLIYDNVLAFRVNGMLMDIFALRSVVAFFCEIYNNIDNVLYKSKFANPNGRSSGELIRNLPLAAKLFSRFGALPNTGFNAAKINHITDPVNSSSWVNTDGYYGSEVEKIYEIAAKNNTTVSNIFLTAYNRTVAAVLNQKNTPVNIASQTDVRQDTKKPGYISYNNAYVMLPYSNTVKENETFLQTLKNITKISTKIKKEHLATRSYVKNHKTYGTTEYFQFASIGQIQKDKYNLSGNQIFEIFFATPARFLPYISITLAAIDKTEIFLTACNYCTQGDLPNIKYLFNYIKYEVRNFINSEDKEFYKTWNERAERAKASGFPIPAAAPAPTAAQLQAQQQAQLQAQQRQQAAAQQQAQMRAQQQAQLQAQQQAQMRAQQAAAQQQHPAAAPVAQVPATHAVPVKAATPTKTTKKTSTAHSKNAKKAAPAHKHVEVKHAPAKKAAPAHKHVEVKHVAASTKWTSEQEQLAKKYKQYTGSTLESSEGGKVKYKIKGKNSFQTRTWPEIKKFVDFKSKK